jgi:hypothetical protein
VDAIKLRTDRRDRLRVYLNDHLAGAVGGVRLARRCRANNTGTELAAFLDGLVTDLEEDYVTLRRLVTDLGLAVARPKQLAAAAIEWIGRFKLNGQLAGYSPLGRLVELEALCAGVDTKRDLWLSLTEGRELEPAVAKLDLDELVARAGRQREGLETHRLAAAAAALGL